MHTHNEPLPQDASGRVRWTERQRGVTEARKGTWPWVELPMDQGTAVKMAQHKAVELLFIS